MAKRKETATTSPIPSIKKKSSSSKKKSRRSQSKYPALDPGLNLKTRTDLIDYDYVHKLSEKDKKWLNKFTEEYTNDSFDRENLRNNLVAKNKTLKKDCDDRNNSRNRCILTMQRASNRIEYLEENKKILGENPEEALNKEMDIQTRHYNDDYNVLGEPVNGKILRRRKEVKK